MATLRERQVYRERVLTALYEASEGNRLLGVPGRKLRNDLRIPEDDLAAACTYLMRRGPDHRRLGTGQHPRDGLPDPPGNPPYGGRRGRRRLSRTAHGPALPLGVSQPAVV